MKNNRLVAVTHNGVFHADDVFAAAILNAVNPDIVLVRTRDEDAIKDADIVFDVGAEYDPARFRFDHHQRGGAGVRENGVPYAAAGLVWKTYGSWLGLSPETCAAVDQNLIQPIDAFDNGCMLLSGVLVKDTVVKGSLNQVISTMNPPWYSDADADVAFGKAMEIAKEILKAEIESAIGKTKAKEIVKTAIQVSKETDPRIVELSQCCPWQEEVIKGAPEALFVIFENQVGTWMVQAVPPELNSFEQRLPLPEKWGGLRSDDLIALTGVDDAVFCHPGRFICGAGSLEGARRLAQIALETRDPKTQ